MLNANIDLIALAKDKTDSGRRVLADVTANELLSHTRDFSDAELKYFGEIFSHLYNHIEPTLKKKIANAVSLADWAPKSLVQLIANDNADIAAPVISFSQKFEDADLERIIKNGTIDHQLRIAERNNIGAVSYTHLDVYKRQAYIFCTAVIFAKCFKNKFIALKCINPKGCFPSQGR